MSRTMILFDFTDGNPGIGTISSIKSPAVEGSYIEKMNMITSFMKEKTNLIVRWPKQHTSSWDLQTYSKENPIDSAFRTGTVFLISDDKDEIATQRNNLIRSRKAVNSQATEEASLSTAKGNKPSFARELFGNQVVSTELESSSTISSSKRPHPNDPMDKEKEELRAKVQKLQEQLKDAEELRAKVQKLEKELEDASHDVADKENEAINLKKELEMLRRKSPTPNDLSDSLYTNLGLVNGLITKLEDIVKSAEAPISKSTTITPPSTPAVTPSNTRRMVQFDGDIQIEYNALRNAISYGRDGNSKEALNAMVGAIIDYYMKFDEQAKYSLSGRACRSIPNSRPKTPFPQDLVDALINFITPKWERWHKVLLNKGQITAAITAKLVNSHTKFLKMQKRIQDDQNNPDAVEEEDNDGA